MLFPLFISVLCASALQAEPIKTPQHVFGGSINPILKDNLNDYPLPTEMTFRAYSNHSIDSCTEYFDPDLVKQGDTIYIADWYLPWFTKYVHPKIQYPYIIISNDSDSWHPDTGIWDYDEANGWFPPVQAIRTLLYDSKVAAWFCKNLVISRHPKLIQIPIGPNIIYWGDGRGNSFHAKEYLLELSTQDPPVKQHLLLLAMQTHTNPIRPKLVDMFKNKPYCFCPDLVNSNDFTKNRKIFYDRLFASSFVLAPPGYGPDTVRVWEAVLLGAIPVVKHYELDDLYSDMPVLFVHEWEEINEDFLKQKYQEIKAKNWDKSRAYFDFWLKKIQTYQVAVRSGNNPFSDMQATAFNPQELDNLQTLLKKNMIHFSDRLLCKGAIMGVRPFELLQKCSFIPYFYVQDPWGAWGNELPTAHLGNHLNPSFKENASRLIPISYYDDAYAVSRSLGVRTHVFFDLSYLRSRLPEDLEYAYQNSAKTTFICGNCANDPYIQEVLDRFKSKFPVQVSVMDTLWFFTK